MRLLRSDYDWPTGGGADYRVIWDAFSNYPPDTPFVFDSRVERDRFFVDLTNAMQEWAIKYPQFAETHLEIDQRCQNSGGYLVTCPDTVPVKANPDSTRSSVKQYTPQPEGIFAPQMNIGVTRTDSGNIYHFLVNFTMPDFPAKWSPSNRFNLIQIYGFQKQGDRMVESTSYKISPVAGNWAPGDAARVEFDVLKEYTDPSQGWYLAFCLHASDESGCLPSSNLLKERVD
jgi:hypothetical protein